MGSWWLLVVALAGCGRIGFDPLPGDGRIATGDDDGATATTDAASGLAIDYAGQFAGRHPIMYTTDTSSVQAHAAGNAVVLLAACESTLAITSVSVTAPGWTFTPIVTLINNGPTYYVETLGAIAPDTTAVNLTVTWNQQCSAGAILADEFTNTVQSVAAFDDALVVGGANDCTGMVTTHHANDAVWAACFSAVNAVGPGPGYTQGADDLGGDLAAYALTSDPAGTVEAPIVFNNPVAFTFAMVTIAPR